MDSVEKDKSDVWDDVGDDDNAMLHDVGPVTRVEVITYSFDEDEDEVDWEEDEDDTTGLLLNDGEAAEIPIEKPDDVAYQASTTHNGKDLGNLSLLATSFDSDSDARAELDWQELEDSVKEKLAADGIIVDEKEKERAESSRKSRKRRRPLSKTDLELGIQKQKTHLCCLLARELAASKSCDDETLQAALLSCLPEHLFLDGTRQLSRSSGGVSHSWVSSLILWFESFFAVKPYSTGCSFDNTSPHDLLVSVGEKSGWPHQLVQLFVSLCRALRIPSRYVCSLDAVPIKYITDKNQNPGLWFGIDPWDTLSTAMQMLSGSNGLKPDRHSKKARRGYYTTALSPAGASVQTGRPTETSKTKQPTVLKDPRGPLRMWAEVWLDDEEKRSKRIQKDNLQRKVTQNNTSWVHVDPLRCYLDKPLRCQELRGRGAVLPYVVAFSASGRCSDVTKRYANRWSKVLPLRLSGEDWWKSLLKAVSQRNVEVSEFRHQPTSIAGASFEEPDEEEHELNEMIRTEPMPTSLEGFKKHHLYVLERMLGVYETLHPRKAVGLFKGEPVFLRSSVHVVHTKDRWFRECKVVKEEELNNPCKIITSKRNKEEKLNCYGEWQTTNYSPPAVVDGIIPRNEHGNVWLLTQNHLPRGSAHVNAPGAARIAKQLGVDYAPALVDFEKKNGKTYPVFDGIVICKEWVLPIQEASFAHEQQEIEKKMAQRTQVVLARWRKFVKAMFIRAELEKEYGKYRNTNQRRSYGKISLSSRAKKS